MAFIFLQVVLPQLYSGVVCFKAIQHLMVMVMTSSDMVDQSLSMLVLQVTLQLKVPVLILLVQLGALLIVLLAQSVRVASMPHQELRPVIHVKLVVTRTLSQRPPPASTARRESGAIQLERVPSRPVLIASRGLTTTRLPPHPSPPVSTADVAATRTPSQRPPPASTVRLGATPPPSVPPLALAAVAATPPQRSQ